MRIGAASALRACEDGETLASRRLGGSWTRSGDETKQKQCRPMTYWPQLSSSIDTSTPYHGRSLQLFSRSCTCSCLFTPFFRAYYPYTANASTTSSKETSARFLQLSSTILSLPISRAIPVAMNRLLTHFFLAIPLRIALSSTENSGASTGIVPVCLQSCLEISLPAGQDQLASPAIVDCKIAALLSPDPPLTCANRPLYTRQRLDIHFPPLLCRVWLQTRSGTYLSACYSR